MGFIRYRLQISLFYPAYSARGYSTDVAALLIIPSPSCKVNNLQLTLENFESKNQRVVDSRL